MQRVMPGDVAKASAHGGACELRAQPLHVYGFGGGSTISAPKVCPAPRMDSSTVLQFQHFSFQVEAAGAVQVGPPMARMTVPQVRYPCSAP